MQIIVTVDENWAIGKKEARLAQIPAEQRHLEALTLGNVVVMGRKTMQALPQGQALYGRENIVLTTRTDFTRKNVTVVHSTEELLEKIKDSRKEIFVIGGESTYKALLPYCNAVEVLYIEKNYDANRHFENLDKSREWVMTEESDEQTYFDMTYYFRKYERVR